MIRIYLVVLEAVSQEIYQWPTNEFTFEMYWDIVDSTCKEYLSVEIWIVG